MEQNMMIGSVILLIIVAVIIALFCMYPLESIVSVVWILNK